MAGQFTHKEAGYVLEVLIREGGREGGREEESENGQVGRMMRGAPKKTMY